MKTLRRFSVVWIVIIASIALCVLFLSLPNNVAYAAQNIDTVIENNEYYIDYSSLDTTSYYREYAVTNRDIKYDKSGEIFSFENGALSLNMKKIKFLFHRNLL